jgi:hypothetical protein
MDYKIDKPSPEEEGDGLPDMKWRLRIIFGAAMAGIAAWGVLIALL